LTIRKWKTIEMAYGSSAQMPAKTTYANERIAEILGTSPSEMAGRDSFAFVFPEDLDAAQRLFELKNSPVQRGWHIEGKRRHLQRFKRRTTLAAGS
jgi:PAS domain S-box-containing protein